jgi:hypothetical protein
MSYRLANSKNGTILLTGRDIPGAITGLERGAVSAAREMLALRAELALIRAENNSLRSRVVSLETKTSAISEWAFRLTERG